MVDVFRGCVCACETGDEKKARKDGKEPPGLRKLVAKKRWSVTVNPNKKCVCAHV